MCTKQGQPNNSRLVEEAWGGFARLRVGCAKGGLDMEEILPGRAIRV